MKANKDTEIRELYERIRAAAIMQRDRDHVPDWMEISEIRIGANLDFDGCTVTLIFYDNRPCGDEILPRCEVSRVWYPSQWHYGLETFIKSQIKEGARARDFERKQAGL